MKPRAVTVHPVAVADAPQWLNTFAMQYKGETKLTLEHCATRIAALEGALRDMLISFEANADYSEDDAEVIANARAVLAQSPNQTSPALPKDVLDTLNDCRESLSRLDDKDGAFRITVLGEVKAILAKYPAA